ncbi:hypothetical protein ACP70R_002770 [Stipagrostis hirtigluma subsp. patula]
MTQNLLLTTENHLGGALAAYHTQLHSHTRRSMNHQVA